MITAKILFTRIIKDFKSKELMPLKLIFFVQASTLYVLYPYLTIHMRELGINVEETAIMSAITPLVAMVMPPLAGMLADRIGNFRRDVSFNHFSRILPLCYLFSHHLVSLYLHTYLHTENYLLCASNNYTFQVFQKYSMQPHIYHMFIINITLLKIYNILKKKINSYFKKSFQQILLSVFSAFGGLAALLLLLVPIGRVTVHFPQRIIMDLGCEGRNGSLLHTMSQIHPCETKLESEIAVKVESCGFVCHIETNNETDGNQILKSRLYTVRHLNFQTGVNTSYKYIVAPNELATNMKQEDMREHRQLKNNEFFKTTIRQVSKTHYFFPTDQLFSFSCMSLPGHVEDIDNFTTETSYRISGNHTSCVYTFFKDHVNRTINYHLYKSKIKSLKPDEDDLREERQRYLSEEISWAGKDFQKPICDNSESINDQITIQVRLYDHEANLEATNRVLNINECRKKCIVTLPRNAVCSNMNMEVEYNVKLTFWIYLVIRVFIGTAWGYIESFLFWLIQDLGGSRSLMGITVAVGGIAGVPLLALSGPIISKIGHANVLFIGFVFYAIRLCGYSLIYDPWLTLIFEALESVTTSLSFTAAVTYAAKLSTTSTDSSIQGLLGGVYYGVGKGSGSLIGGYLMKAFGTRPTYQIFSVVTLLTGIIYFIFNVTYLKKRSQIEGNDIVKKKPKNIDKQDSPEKHTNDISLEEKSQQIDNKSNIMGNDNKGFVKEESQQIDNKSNIMGNDNKGFVKEESHNNKKPDELDLTEIKDIRNAKNIDDIESNINSNFETDNLDQSKIIVEKKRLNRKSTSISIEFTGRFLRIPDLTVVN
ncbi:Major facilitator superfamily domain-containing protein 6-B [Cyphomyrmex costatus]|uniref:Major facilitator superfamily domain-containing protein 6-B n=1 Tax=Cyphomyrmex costatus TaxID=456900 RepID=A0A151IQB0_9HYME|nr:Major facilitator superfamily domain-containing protein 6-B [Cyphomyrmex costatus]